MFIKRSEKAPIIIDLGVRAQRSARAILGIRSPFEIGHGAEVTATVRPQETFRSERLAVLASCAGAFDLVDLKVAFCSVFADKATGADVPVDKDAGTGVPADKDASPAIPAVRYAAAYELLPPPAEEVWILGPHRAVISDETRFGLAITSQVCPVGHDVAITVRHRQGAPSVALEVLILGTVISAAEGHQIYLRERQALEQAWLRRVGDQSL